MLNSRHSVLEWRRQHLPVTHSSLQNNVVGRYPSILSMQHNARLFVFAELIIEEIHAVKGRDTGTCGLLVVSVILRNNAAWLDVVVHVHHKQHSQHG